MKKLACLLFILCSLFILSGCTSSDKLLDKLEEEINEVEDEFDDNIEEETTTTTTEKTSSTTSNNKGLSKEFLNAMNKYEEFMDEYIAFMKKYQKSGGTDLSLLTDYTKYLQKYTEAVNEFNKWNSEKLNKAEVEYFIEVQTRVTKKLEEVT